MIWEVLVHPRIIRASSPLDCEMAKMTPWMEMPQDRAKGKSSAGPITVSQDDLQRKPLSALGQ